MENQRLNLPRKHCRGRVFEALVGVIKTVESGFAERSVLASHKRDKALVRYLIRVPVLVASVGEFQIRVVEHRKNVVGRIYDFTRERDNFLLVFRENMLALNTNFIECAAIKLQIGTIRVKFLQRFIAD